MTSSDARRRCYSSLSIFWNASPRYVVSDLSGFVFCFSEEEFNKILKEAGDKLVVVDISTKTCGPCKMIFPKIVEMSLEYPDAVFLKINGDTNNDTRVCSVPYPSALTEIKPESSCFCSL